MSLQQSETILGFRPSVDSIRIRHLLKTLVRALSPILTAQMQSKRTQDQQMAQMADEVLHQLTSLKEGRIKGEDEQQSAEPPSEDPPQRFIAVEESELSATNRVYFRRPLPEVPVLPDKYGFSDSSHSSEANRKGKGADQLTLEKKSSGERNKAAAQSAHHSQQNPDECEAHGE